MCLDRYLCSGLGHVHKYGEVKPTTIMGCLGHVHKYGEVKPTTIMGCQASQFC
jgi:hypothetical protein